MNLAKKNPGGSNVILIGFQPATLNFMHRCVDNPNVSQAVSIGRICLHEGKIAGLGSHF